VIAPFERPLVRGRVSIGEAFGSVPVLSVAAALIFIGLFTVARCWLTMDDSRLNHPGAKMPLSSVPERPGLQMQLVWTDTQLDSIFSPTTPSQSLPSADRRLLRDEIVYHTTIDSLAFVPLYAAFFVVLAALGQAAHNRKAAVLFIAIVAGVATAVVADWLENIAIIEAAEHLSAGTIGAMDARDISDSSLVKWTSQAVVLAATAWLLVSARLWWTWLLGLAAFAVAAAITFVLIAYAYERLTLEVRTAAVVMERTALG
jgi:hypothetical protein